MASRRRAYLRCIAVVRPPPRLAVLPEIPDDLIFNILARLPAKSIIRFKSVCKAWLAMLSSRCFIDAHLELSKARPSMLIVAREFEFRRQWRGLRGAFWIGYYKYNGGDVPEFVHNQHIIPCGGGVRWAKPLHCDGLVLFFTRDQIMVCNPATRESLALPAKESDAIGFGRDPCTNRYKLARAFYEREAIDGTVKCILRFEVLTLGTNVWRPIANPPRLHVRMPPVHVQGFIYWTAYVQNDSHVLLARFSLADETFSKTPYPPCELGEKYYAYFTELEGELCSVVVPLTCEMAQIWTYKGTDKPTWTLCFTVPLPQETISESIWLILTPPNLTFHGKDILLRGGHNLYKYNTETKEMKKVDVAVEDLRYYHPENNNYKEFSGDQVAFHIVNYAESLVPIREGDNSCSVKQRVFSVLARTFHRTCNLITNGWAVASRRR
ncbi:hypothetical protein BAE44_0019467 [Dichanthelium oligosanthes]|uniref:F-box domain-containing protein n=1 Tax=Dichanthelium oligosanthes TaxID=888268 RepID=A0A1E5V2X1_9POAL|nr:hypothetical protein BAE44_0019467 [Dichanthelium oligosanthes]